MCRIGTKCGNHEIITSGVENADHSEGQYVNEVLLLGPIQLEKKIKSQACFEINIKFFKMFFSFKAMFTLWADSL